MRELILNADDFGWDADTCDATIACFEAGLLTSATIMTGRPASQQAYDYARRNRGRFSFGLHFNMVDGHLPHAGRPSSLCSRDGRFRASHRQRVRALAWMLSEHDIAREFRVQLEELRDNGVEVTHVDSHGHLHKFPIVISSLRTELERAGLEWVRRPQNFYFTANPRQAVMNSYCQRYFSGLRHTHYYGAINHDNTDWAARLPELLRDGITEISVHPGYAEPWRRGETEPLVNAAALRTALQRAGIALRRYGQ
ncbi:hypothetical protein CR3_2959 [Cupriavidus gilardii CR3]|uniref:ChbG/HpnK family deacetylase n=1 Tax=Cupriavidus gilardii TaxID=82541 RepID=UPI0006B2E7C9|nr:ChbG/HpnK family deacetylase [Cupriavidus gilardii]ALD92147.1 hypothetical protein CR3_2959 [Cupriavidus gilardii CR3]MCT9014921.1 ChbG/HpnK family deacetylase [Cupriavidus gilardii]MCT9053333.1 ChbG/HpnK family deacetylase [Cupriavidus gilardii]MCT9069862.1 ChbG/HpnK family deacetylase [Cupriavidus gilardii]MCT9126897.1 ChbG/HpnK family deacetylase [Cupriavidus gilardii]